MKYFLFSFSSLKSFIFAVLFVVGFLSKVSNAITLATSADWEPFEFIKDGEMVGIDIDLVKEIEKETGLSIDIVEGPFDGLLDQLAEGKFDGVISAVTITPERQSKFDFTQEYSSLEGGVGIALQKGSPYLSVLNSAISKLKSNGTIKKIEAKYGK